MRLLVADLVLVCLAATEAFVVPRSGTPRRTAVEAVSVPVRTFEGAQSGSATMDLRTAASGKDMYVVHKKYVHERRSARAGTASTKTRGEVRGGGRKPYKQKGTGNARRGSTRSPLIVGGGVIFGPKPKNWANKKINKKEGALAVSIALQNKANRAVVVDADFKLDGPPKTKKIVDFIRNLDIDEADNVLLVYDDYDETFDKAQANLPKTVFRRQDKITVSDMLWANNVVFSKKSFDWVTNKYGRPEANDDDSE